MSVEYARYIEQQAERDVTAANFSNGEINYRFHMYEKDKFMPSKSFFKFRIKFSKGDGSQLDRSFGVAPNMYVCDNLFQQLSMYCNGVCIGRVNDYVAQVGALKNRTSFSETNREKLGSFMYLPQASANKRLNQVSSDGIDWDEYEETYVKPGNPASTVALGAGDGIITGVNTTFTSLSEGDKFLINGIELTITDITNDTQMNVEPVLATAIPATSNWMIKTEKPSRRKDEIEMIWRPPLGFWDLNEWVSGDFKFVMTPQPSSVIEKYAVESLRPADTVVPGNTITDFKVEVSTMLLYLYKGYGEPFSGEKSYTYNDYRCQSQTLTTSSLTNKQFNVHPKARELTLAFQQSGAGDNIRHSRSKFKVESDAELNLVRFFIKYGAYSLPDPIPSMSVTNSQDFIAQQYYESLLYGDSHKNENPESLDEWKERGAFYTLRFPKAKSMGDKVLVSSQFTSLPNNKPQMLLFDKYPTNLKMMMRNGRVERVISDCDEY